MKESKKASMLYHDRLESVLEFTEGDDCLLGEVMGAYVKFILYGEITESDNPIVRGCLKLLLKGEAIASEKYHISVVKSTWGSNMHRAKDAEDYKKRLEENGQTPEEISDGLDWYFAKKGIEPITSLYPTISTDDGTISDKKRQDTVTVIDTDTDIVTEKDTATGIDTFTKKIGSNRSAFSDEKTTGQKTAKQYPYDFIDDLAKEVAEKDNGYVYSPMFVDLFYRINSERGWVGNDGQPIQDILAWYKRLYDTEKDHWTIGSLCEMNDPDAVF